MTASQGVTTSAEVLPLPPSGPPISFLRTHCSKNGDAGVSSGVERALLKKHAACLYLERVQRGLVWPPGNKELLLGLEVVHLFIADLLGRSTAEGKTFVAMAGEE